MSWRAIVWARGQRAAPGGEPLTEGERHLLLLLATHHSEIVPDWPLVETLADEMGVKVRRVQQVLTALECKGMFTRDRRGGRGHATSYTLPLPERVQLSASTAEKSAADCTLSAVMGAADCTLSDGDPQKGAIFDTERVQSAEGKGAILTNDGGTIGGSTEGLPGVPSPPVLSGPSETIAVGGHPKRRTPPAKTFDLEAVTAELVAAYAGLWPEAEVRERIAYALQHKKGGQVWTDKALGLKRWLGKDAKDEHASVNGSHRGREGPERERTRPQGQGQGRGQQSDFAFFRERAGPPVS